MSAGPPGSVSPLLSPPAILPRRIVLTGFMGAGKSTVGRILAARLRWPFLDVDSVITFCRTAIDCARAEKPKTRSSREGDGRGEWSLTGRG